VFVAGVGTGGTITGVGRYLKKQRPDVQIVGADPEGSIYAGGSAHPYLVEGVGEDFWPETYDPAVVDRYVTVSDRVSFLTARELTRHEGIMVGGSCGTAAHAARVVAAEYPEDAVIVVLLPDTGRNYLSKLYNDEWMAANGFLTRRGGGNRLSVVLAAKRGTLPAIVHIHPDESVRQAISILHEFDVSQMPVVKRDTLESRDDVIGSIRERELLERVYREPAMLDASVADVMEAPLPMVDERDSVESLMPSLSAEWQAVLVCSGAVPSGVLTRSDVLDFLVQPS
jgi:cystathionine beta-synthase